MKDKLFDFLTDMFINVMYFWCIVREFIEERYLRLRTKHKEARTRRWLEKNQEDPDDESEWHECGGLCPPEREDIEQELLADPFGDADETETTVPKNATAEQKGLPIKLVKRGGTAAERMEYRRRHLTEQVYECVDMTLPTEAITPGGKIPFEHLDTACELLINKKTAVCAKNGEVTHVLFKRPDVYYRTETESKRYPCTCLCAVDDETYAMFDTYKDFEEKTEKIQVFANLSPLQREFVLTMARRPVQTEKDGQCDDIYTPIRDLDALKMMYEVCRNTYKPSVRARVDSLLSQLDTANGSDRADLINQLGFAIGIDTAVRERPKRTYEECMAIMDKHVYGLQELKENVVEFIISMQESGASFFQMLLVGPPGVGKTSFTNGIAECLGDAPVVHIDCSGVNVITMSGLIKSYSGAKAGKVIDGLYAKGQTDLVMLLDEVDKMASDKDGDPYGALIKPLGPDRLYFDEYVADDTDVSATKFIATANDVSKIPGFILSRFENNIFYLEAYTVQEKLEIAQKHIIPRKRAEYKLSEEDCVFEDEAIRLVIEEYCSDEGVREMEGNLTVLFRKIITERSRGMIEMPFRVDADYVRTHLKKALRPDAHKRVLGFAG